MKQHEIKLLESYISSYHFNNCSCRTTTFLLGLKDLGWSFFASDLLLASMDATMNLLRLKNVLLFMPEDSYTIRLCLES